MKDKNQVYQDLVSKHEQRKDNEGTRVMFNLVDIGVIGLLIMFGYVLISNDWVLRPLAMAGCGAACIFGVGYLVRRVINYLAQN